MHGLVLRTLQVFLRDTYGTECWADVAARACLDPSEFEAMLRYDPALLDQILAAAEAVLGKPREALIEDVGIYLVSHPNCDPLRRLLRYGGRDFIDFLYSLEDLPDRTRLAVPDLDIPDLSLVDKDGECFTLMVKGDVPGFGHVLVGMLRAMADDYGALAVLEYTGTHPGGESVSITVVRTDYAKGKGFALAAGPGAARA